MTTASQAFAVIKARLEANPGLGPYRWPNEDAPALPDTPASFVFIDFNPDRGFFAAFGGGRGANEQHNTAALTLYQFVPRGEGLASATDKAEALAALFRSYRDADISCFAASVIPGGSGSLMRPPGVESEVDNYYFCVAEIELFYRLLG